MTKEVESKKTNKKNHRNQRGITLIALVITIIVMLILVAVTVTVAINGGLFGMAKEAKTKTEEARDVEQELANGRILVGDTWYDSMEDYVNGTPSENQNDDSAGGGSGTGHEGTYDATPKNEDGTLTANATYDTATIPAGFMVSDKKEEQEIETGLVIKDVNGNEFVWIPIEENLVNPYNTTIYDDTYSEPKTLSSYESQSVLNEYYGDNYYKYEEDFKYEEEYAKMLEQVNKYHGFYIGRYETTIDSDKKIGSKYDTTILTADKIIKEGTNENNHEPYYYRWYGLYYASKNADVTGNGDVVQTAMIYGQLWDKTMDFIRDQKEAGKTSYNVDEVTEAWHEGSSIVNAGTTNYGDVALNIWDLESNGWEWTQEASFYERPSSTRRQLLLQRRGFVPRLQLHAHVLGKLLLFSPCTLHQKLMF